MTEDQVFSVLKSSQLQYEATAMFSWPNYARCDLDLHVQVHNFTAPKPADDVYNAHHLLKSSRKHESVPHSNQDLNQVD